jgi:hypothetical protein
MRLPVALLCVLLMTRSAALVAGQEAAPPTTTVPPPPAATQETKVQGTVPDLTGRWLALATLRLPGDKLRFSPALWEVGTKEGHPDLVVRFVDLPVALQTTIDERSAAGTDWAPSAADLRALADAWATLPPREAQLALLETTLSAPDGFDDTLRAEPRTKDALWVATQAVTFAAAAAPAVRQVLVYVAREATPDRGYSGLYVSTTIAAAPFPIPISFEGTFRLYPIAPATPGFWQRLFGVFAGCGS